MVLWALFSARKQLHGIAAAGDRDQARILRDSIGRLVSANPWLRDFITVQRYEVRNSITGSTLEVISSDTASSYGHLCDFVVVDELSHWPESAEEFYTSLRSTAAKRRSCVFVAIMNAGYEGSFQHKLSLAAQDNPRIYYSHLPGTVATWLKDSFDELSKEIPPHAVDRLINNNWTSGGGDALTPQDIAAAEDNNAREMTGEEYGWEFVGGLDLGLKRDNAAFVVLAVNRNTRQIRLARVDTWKPSEAADGKVSLSDVEDTMIYRKRQFKLDHVRYDPWQAEHIAQRVEGNTDYGIRARDSAYNRQPFMREVTPTAVNLREIARIVIESFTDRRLTLYPCPELHADLRKLRVEEKSYGFRLTSPRDATGHGDTVTAFALALLGAYELSATPNDHYRFVTF